MKLFDWLMDKLEGVWFWILDLSAKIKGLDIRTIFLTDPKSYPFRNAFSIEIDFMEFVLNDSLESLIVQRGDKMTMLFDKKYGRRIGSKHNITLMQNDIRLGVWSFGAYCKSPEETLYMSKFAESCARKCGFKVGGIAP